ncbi:unnamed protein product, partial [Coregonus sp. 'balchen']
MVKNDRITDGQRLDGPLSLVPMDSPGEGVVQPYHRSPKLHPKISEERDEACASPVHNCPLQFDKVCCALGSAAVTTGRRYWEADVRSCSGCGRGLQLPGQEGAGQRCQAGTVQELVVRGALGWASLHPGTTTGPWRAPPVGERCQGASSVHGAPLHPAFRFLRPPEGQVWASHMEIQDVNTPIAIHK